MSEKAASRRSCDRCYSTKERCVWSTKTKTCDRCLRLKHRCENKRAIKRIGRPSRNAVSPNSTTSIESSTSTSTTVYTKNSPSEVTKDLTTGSLCCTPKLSSDLFPTRDPVEQFLIHSLSDGKRTLDCFLIGPSFTETHQRALTTRLYSAKPLLKDAYFACSSICSVDRNKPLLGQLRDTCFASAASALKSLRSFKVSDRYDLSVCLTLGLAVVTFALMSGGDTLPICRYTLELVKTVDDPVSLMDADGFSFLVSINLVESSDCLFRRSIPTMRLENRDDGFVDRFLGISTPALTYLFDICELSDALYYADKSDLDGILEALARIEDEVENWQPSHPATFLNEFSRVEITHMLSQVQLYRLTLLLVIHRLRHPFGEHDEKAAFMSKTMRRELDFMSRLTDRAIRSTFFPFMVACLEITDKQERLDALDRVAEIVGYSVHFQEKFRLRLLACWELVDNQKALYWFNLADYLPDTL